jgi:uncharacterized protein
MATEHEKPSNQEEDYFKREEIEQKRKLAHKQAEALATQQREALKALHHMKCPKCGLDLQTLKQGSVEIDTCFNCKGIWLDAGELEQLGAHASHKAPSVMSAVLNLFKRS